MVRFLALFLVGVLLPVTAGASTLRADKSLDVSASPEGNAYLAGTNVSVDAPLLGDLLAAALDLAINAPVSGDVLSLAGVLHLSSPVAGDLRGVGERIRINGSVGGDLALFGGSISVTAPVHEVHAAGGTIELRSGAQGPVTLYGGTVLLAGTFNGDVRVFASDHVTLAEGTVIHGAFNYNAPQEAGIPASAVIDEGTTYVGSSSFLPTEEEARTFAIAGIGIFFLVRMVAAMLAAGLVAGLFPVFALRICETALVHSPKQSFILTLLGGAVIIGTPLVLVLLVISFVGMGIAALVGSLYLLSLLLSYLYAGVLLGYAFMRVVLKRKEITWKGALVGMVLLTCIGLIPYVGMLIVFTLSCMALGALFQVCYRFLFSHSRMFE